MHGSVAYVLVVAVCAEVYFLTLNTFLSNSPPQLSMIPENIYPVLKDIKTIQFHSKTISNVNITIS